MKLKKRLWLGSLCATALLVSACAKSEPVSMPVVLGTEPGASDISEQTSGAEAVPTVVIQTDGRGQIITDSGGHPMISVVETTAASTEVPADTNTPGSATVTADGLSFTTTGAKNPHTNMPAVPRPTTTRRTAESTAPQSTVPAATSSTTAKPTHKTSTTNSPATTEASKPTDPWRYPYDLPAIYADCKREIERLGMVWEEDLRPDSLGVSWENPDNTVVFSYYPDEFSLRDEILNNLIPYYKKQPYSRQTCRIWFESKEGSPGNYMFYFLERY